MKPRRATLLALALTLAVPASASAATTIGSSMPAFTGDSLVCDDPGGCTFVPTTISGTPVVVPFDGVIVSWSARVPDGAAPIGLRVVRPAAGGALTGVDLPDTGIPAADGTIAGTARQRVRAGDLIGVELDDGEEIGVVEHAAFDSASHTFAPRLLRDQTRVPTSTDSDDFEMLFNAVVEPDADRDGYGDETEDGCPELAETRFRCLGLASVGLQASSPGGSTKTGMAVVMAGQRMRITASVASAGHRLPNASLTFTLPPELKAVGATGPSACTVAPERVTCPLGQIAASSLGRNATRTSVSASVDVQAIKPGTHRVFPASPPLAGFVVGLTTGLRTPPSPRTGYVRVLAPGACANRNVMSFLEPESFGGDRLVGGPLTDKANALAGDDCLSGRAGDDVLAGGDGHDRVDGGQGRDILRGESGDDALIGGPGRDRLEGGSAADRLAAVDGERDLVRCGPGRDRARADAVDSVAGCESVKRVPAAKRRKR